jgi:27-O-demethylrifamycin SV methyltransferase
MAEMNWFARRLVNFSNERRSARLLDRIAGHLDLSPSARILELGAGRGGLSALLQERYRPSRLVVSELDPAQLEAARRYLSARLAPLPPSIELRIVDAKALPFGAGSFDLVFAIQMLHHVEARHSDYRERPNALEGIRRVLAPGGSFVLSDFTRVREMRDTLAELGFIPIIERTGWSGRFLGVFRAPP